MTTNYRRGVSVEYAAMKEFRRRGFPFVQRSAKSHGLADVVAVRPGQVVLAQCKLRMDISPGEWNELWAIANVLAEYHQRATSLMDVAAVVVGRPVNRGPLVMLRLTGPRVPRGKKSWIPFA